MAQFTEDLTSKTDLEIVESIRNASDWSEFHNEVLLKEANRRGIRIEFDRREINAVPTLCSICQTLNKNVKNYPLVFFKFYLIAYRWGSSIIPSCPRCARKLIWKHCLYELARENIAWPFISLPWTLILTLWSFIPGKSSLQKRKARNSKVVEYYYRTR